MMRNPRNSSIELLRLICMIAIVLHHFIISVISPNYTYRGWTFVDLILHTSVVIFILISGYYGIRFKVGRFFQTIGIVLFWSILLTLIGKLGFGRGNMSEILDSILPLSGSGYWFVTVYLELYLVSPFLNTLIENLDKYKFQLFICLLFFFVVYLGLFRHDVYFATGKNLSNFILVYSIGRYLNKYDSFKPKHNWLLGGIILGVFCIICMLPNSHNLYVHGCAFAYQYNSPLNILLSVFIFNIVRSYTFSSTIVNKLAISTFPIYLIHEHPIMRDIIYVEPLSEYILPLGGGLLSIAFAFALSAGCILIDQPRILIFKFITNINKSKN